MWFTIGHFLENNGLRTNIMKCKYCQNNCIKKGKRSYGKQTYLCNGCKKYQQKDYTKEPIAQEKYEWVHNLNNEGNSMSSIGRLLHISVSSVQRVICRLVALLQKPVFKETGQSYEIDELKTFCGNKDNELWLIYAINRKSKQVMEFLVGRRTKENIKQVIDTLLKLEPKHIYSDRLNIYPALLPVNIHRVYPKCTNYIERKNLTLRIQLKPLNRKTLCFTRSVTMLSLKFHLWAWR